MGSTKATTTPSSPHFLLPLITIDVSLSLFLHTLFKLSSPLFSFSSSNTPPISIFPSRFPPLFLVSPSLSSLAIPLILVLLLDLALIRLIKLTFCRARPHYNPNMSLAVHAGNSFPSGHASRVLFLATLFHLIFQNNKELVSDFILRRIKIEPSCVVLGVWVWAIMTATSRVLLGRHLFFDVLAGTFIGALEGIVAYRFLRV